MIHVTAFALAALLTVANQEAVAPTECPAPTLPAAQRPVKPTRPATPSCVDEARGRHTCSNRVIHDYEAKMQTYGTAFDAYVNAVNGYQAQLNAYVDQVNAYVQCEQRVVMPSRFISG